MAIDFRHLKHLIAVDEAGSVSTGAKLANLTQSALTRSLARAEAELGFKLFYRRAHGVTATVDGREFLDRAKRIVMELDLLIEDAHRQSRREQSILRVGVCPPAISPFLGEPLADLLALKPDLVLQMTAHSVERALRFLKRGDFDLLIGPVDIFVGEGSLSFREVGKLEAFPFVRKGHPLAGRDGLTRRDLRQFAMVIPDAPTQIPSYLSVFEEIYGGPDGKAVEVLSVVENFHLITEIVSSSDRIGIIGRDYHESEGFSRRFQLLEIDLLPPLPIATAKLAIGSDNATSQRLSGLLAKHLS